LNVLKELFKHEVYPALGCTEPIAVAYTASLAANELEGELEEITIFTDPGVYKNGMAVTVPNTNGERGNLIAGVLGAIIRKPESKMEILKHADQEMINQSKAYIESGKAKIILDKDKKDLYIEVRLKTLHGYSRAVVEHAHTNLVYLEANNRVIFEKKTSVGDSSNQAYRSILQEMTILEMIDLVDHLDDEDKAYIKLGIEMNLEISKVGQNLNKVGYYIHDLTNKGFIHDDIFSSSKIMTASASDARMSGVNLPVMTSGNSGNQGIVAVLVPYNVGKYYQIDEGKIVQSIALSHLVNSYVKCFIGDLSPLCGASISAGVGAAVAIVYQQCGGDNGKITYAVNTLISDLGGMLCDGAKAGCALKVATSTDSAIRAAYMAINNQGITDKEGFVGKSAEETIYHLSRIGKIGMGKADETMLEIMMGKN